MTSHKKDKKRNAMIRKIKAAEQARKDALDAEVKQEIKRRNTPMKEAILSVINEMMKPIEPVKGKPNWKKAQDISDKLKNPKSKPKYKKPKHDPLEGAWKDVAKKKFEPKD